MVTPSRTSRVVSPPPRLTTGPETRDVAWRGTDPWELPTGHRKPPDDLSFIVLLKEMVLTDMLMYNVD